MIRVGRLVFYRPDPKLFYLKIEPLWCHMPLFNHSQSVRARDLQFSHDIHHTLCVICLVSHVRCHMLLVTCHVSLVICHMSYDTILISIFFLQIVWVSLWRVCYQQGLPLLVFLITKAMIPIGLFWVIKKIKILIIIF